MSLAATGLWVSTVWLVIYAVKYSSRRSKSLLPLSRNRRPSTEFTVKNLNLRLKTETFNAFHDELTAWLSLDHSRICRQILIRIYDIGCLVSTIGMLASFGFLVQMTATLSLQVLQPGPLAQLNASVLTKRGFMDISDTAPAAVPGPDALRINLIIPGVTVPLHHLPVILLALCVSQVIHESGHAITSALHRIPMLSCGIAVTLILPSAFVTLPSVRLEKLFPRERMQIVSSGCFHNFAFWCFLLLVAWSGLAQLPTWFFFQDVSALGKLVVGVDSDSPLAAHIPVNAVITEVDDVPMARVSLEDPWDRYLLSPSPSFDTLGWCVNRTLVIQASVPECTSRSQESCFTSKEDETMQYSLDPVPIFMKSVERCNSTLDCAQSSSCVVPRSDQQLVRITLTQSLGGKTTEVILVWKGPKEEIWEQVEVDSLRPRFVFVSRRLPRIASVFFEYMKIANLSLYLVNMLPISGLDGHQFLSGLLQFLCGRAYAGLDSFDLEAHNNPTLLAGEAWMQRCRAFVSIGAIALVALCALLSVISRIIK